LLEHLPPSPEDPPPHELGCQTDGRTTRAAIVSLVHRLTGPLRDLEAAAAVLTQRESTRASSTVQALRASIEVLFATVDEALDMPRDVAAELDVAPSYVYLPRDPEEASVAGLLRSLGSTVTVVADLRELEDIPRTQNGPLPLLFVSESRSTRLLAQAAAGRLRMRLVLLCPPDRAAELSALARELAIPLAQPVRRAEALFVLSSPRSPPASEESIAIPPPPAPVAPAKGRVLVVDDNGVNRAMAQRMIQRCGFDVDIAENGARALAAMRAHPYELVLMDCEMPGLDGWTATRAMRVLERSTGRRVPIIALTSGDRAEDRAGCRRAGMDGHLAKPLHADRLGAVLRRWTRSGGSSAAARSPAPASAPHP
jgi:CheY-like chemotaxis protein